MDDIEPITFDTIHIFPIFMRNYDSNIEYDIDVVYFNEKPKQSYEDIETIKMSGEVPLEDKQIQNGKMLMEIPD